MIFLYWFSVLKPLQFGKVIMSAKVVHLHRPVNTNSTPALSEPNKRARIWKDIDPKDTGVVKAIKAGFEDLRSSIHSSEIYKKLINNRFRHIAGGALGAVTTYYLTHYRKAASLPWRLTISSAGGLASAMIANFLASKKTKSSKIYSDTDINKITSDINQAHFDLDQSWSLKRYHHCLKSIADHPDVKKLKNLTQPEKTPKTDNQHIHDAVRKTNKIINFVRGATDEINQLGPKVRFKKTIENIRNVHNLLHSKNKHGAVNIPEPIRTQIETTLNTVVTALYTADLKDFTVDFIKAIKKRSSEYTSPEWNNIKELSYTKIAELLTASRDAINSQSDVLKGGTKTSKFFQKMDDIFRGELGIGYDAALQGNTQYKLYDFDHKGKPVTVIRMGTQTRQNTQYSVKIIEEFKAYLNSLDETQHHVYFNRQVQDYAQSSGVHKISSHPNEINRSNAMKALAEDGAFSDKLTFISIPADGPFYNGLGEFKENKDFINEMAENITGNKQGFYIPDSIKNKQEFNDKVRELIQTQHENLGSPNLTGPDAVDTRRAFVFHFINVTLQNFLIDKVNEHLEETPARVSSMNVSCKDDIDRGAMSTLYRFLVSQDLKEIDTPKKREEFMALAEAYGFAPAIFVKKRPPNGRFHDVVNTLRHLDKW